MTKQAAENKTKDTVSADEIVNTSKIADSAREFVKRTAVNAKERSDNLYQGTEKLNSGLEKTLNRVVSDYVGFLSNVAEVTHADVARALTTAEKLAAAKSLSEAAQINIDYVRENTAANVERISAAADMTRKMVMDGTEMLRENASKVFPYGKQAA